MAERLFELIYPEGVDVPKGKILLKSDGFDIWFGQFPAPVQARIQEFFSPGIYNDHWEIKIATKNPDPMPPLPPPAGTGQPPPSKGSAGSARPPKSIPEGAICCCPSCLKKR